MAKEFSYIGGGKLYLRDTTGTTGLLPVGNADAIKIGITEDKKELKDFTGSGGLANSLSKIDKVELSITMRDFLSSNLAIAVFGSDNAITAGAVTGEAHTAHPDALIPLTYIQPSSVVVTNTSATVTFAPNTDYEVTGAGIVILSTGAITDGQAILVDYAYSASKLVKSLINSGSEYEAVFDGVNKAQGDKTLVARMFRVKFSPAGALDLIQEDFASLELTGSILKDTTKTGAGESQFFEWAQVE